LKETSMKSLATTIPPDLHLRLHDRVPGQLHAIATVTQRLRAARVGRGDPDGPLAAGLFVGPGEAGRTRTALALAELVYGGAHALVAVDMAACTGQHEVEALRHVLADLLRRDPRRVLLLDRLERAHPSAVTLLRQVLAYGTLDSADARQAIVMATTDIGVQSIAQACHGRAGAALPAPLELELLIRPALARQFGTALLDRLQLVPFYPVDCPGAMPQRLRAA
jgi:type VI secretion system protein VasG